MEYVIPEFAYLGQTLVCVAIMFFILVICKIISDGCTSRKTYEYRKDMANLYVTGKIKQIATKDNVNLDVEFEDFKKFMKKQKLSDQPLDVTVKEELQEKITESTKVTLDKE